MIHWKTAGLFCPINAAYGWLWMLLVVSRWMLGCLWMLLITPMRFQISQDFSVSPGNQDSQEVLSKAGGVFALEAMALEGFIYLDRFGTEEAING